MRANFPNLFLAGAPKCGTTSLYDWLAQHPDIFAPIIKEPIYFGSDLTSQFERRSKENYLSLYNSRGKERFALDGSTHYFYAQKAPAEIASTVPDARVIIALRHPAEAAHSMFHQLCFNGSETLPDFAASLDAEADRAANMEPVRKGFPENLLYSRVYAYRANVTRYFEQFGPARVKVILLDDLKAKPEMVIAEIFEWLEIDASLATSINTSASNGAKKQRSKIIGDFAAYPPAWIGKVTSQFFNAETRYKVRRFLRNMNTAPSSNPPLQSEERERLIARHSEDISWLEETLDRDLGAWRQ